MTRRGPAGIYAIREGTWDGYYFVHVPDGVDRLTALEVAKPQFRAAFMAEGQGHRPQSSLSDRTIRPSTSMSLSSITSFANWVSAIQPASSHEPRGPAGHLPPDFDITTTSEQLLDNFQHLSAGAYHVRDYAECNQLASVVQETSQLGDDVLAYFRGQIDDAARELRSTREILNSVDRQWNQVSQEAEEQLSLQGPIHSRFARLHQQSPRGSEDSQSTAVESDVRLSKEEQMKKYVDVSVLTDPVQPLETTSPSGVRTVPWPEWLDNYILSADSSTYQTHLANLIEIERALFSRDSTSTLEERPSPKDRNLKALLKSYKFHTKNEKKGASKLKAWLKKKIVSGKPLRVQLCYDLDDPHCAVGRQAKQDVDFQKPIPIVTVTDTEGICRSRPSLSASLSDVSSSGNTTHSVQVVLSAASRDLSAIDECLHAVSVFFSLKLPIWVLISHTRYQDRPPHLHREPFYRSGRTYHQANGQGELTALFKVSAANLISVQVRGGMVENLRSRYPPVDDPFAFLPDRTTAMATRSRANSSQLTLSSSMFYLSPPDSGSDGSSPTSSAQSSVISLAISRREEEDEDTRALRRLILRKISAQVDGAYDEVDRANTWLCVVRTVLRDLSTRVSVSSMAAS